MKETFHDLEEAKHGEHDVLNGEGILFYTISNLPTTFFMCVFTFLCTWSLTSLTFFHAVIISVAQTTNERVRNVYKDGRREHGLENPADQGCYANWVNMFCTVVPESRIPEDFSEEVDCIEARRRRDEAIKIANEDKVVDEDEDDVEDNECGTEDEKSEKVYDSEKAAKAVASSVVNGIVYSV